MTSIMKLSIIIPCYNCAATLREAVDSCYTQGFNEDEFEIVMVDDGSTDTTRELMKAIASEHTNIKLFFHDKNQGGGATRNTAVGHSRSEVLFCLDSDDLLPPQTLNAMLAYLEEKNCDAVTFHTSINFIGTDTTNISHIVTMNNPGERIVFTDLFQTPKAMCGLYQVFMLKKEAFMKTGGYPTHHGFDTQGFAWRFMNAGLSAYTCPDTTYLLRVKFKESYYLREYNSGKNNFNWQAIFLEHLPLFTTSTQEFISNFDCRDFTKDIYTELITRKGILREDYQTLIGVKLKQTIPVISAQKPISRNSPLGVYFRIKHKIINYLHQ